MRQKNTQHGYAAINMNQLNAIDQKRNHQRHKIIAVVESPIGCTNVMQTILVNGLHQNKKRSQYDILGCSKTYHSKVKDY
jgi:hypothetical protein